MEVGAGAGVRHFEQHCPDNLPPYVAWLIIVGFLVLW
jgi:hypothetical protein